VADDLDDVVRIRPDEEILAETRILLSGPSHDRQLIIFLLAPGQRPGRTFGDADAAADTFLLVPDDLVVFHPQGVHRQLLAALHAGLAVDAAGRIVLRHRHADDAKIMHPRL